MKKSVDSMNNTNSSGVVAVIFGILSIFSGVPGIAFGIIGFAFAYNQKKNSPNRWSMWGMWLSIVGFVLGVVIAYYYWKAISNITLPGY